MSQVDWTVKARHTHASFSGAWHCLPHTPSTLHFFHSELHHDSRVRNCRPRPGRSVPAPATRPTNGGAGSCPGNA
ncbi:hypothetical protein E2C01_097742 [Portunus trituberculatus]|uniref:Uncharacterized protein n=1 Tax=Portunus trituberculatus TaxID=210409 RepID=A0A5B7JZF9_PORTR|nr:hypothetical protein [Portunus trituberculatus]